MLSQKHFEDINMKPEYLTKDMDDSREEKCSLAVDRL